MAPENRRRVLMGLLFFPRGGSSHVAHNLASALPAAGWTPSILSGSLRIPGRPGEARAFYAGLDVHTVDFTAALSAPDPLLADPPFHPSYEERPGAPDPIMCSLDDDRFERQVRAWARALADAGAADADVLHLHHLTPMNEAAARSFPGVPVIGHLHGTELLMLNEIEKGAPESWEFASEWADRMRGWARQCERLLVLSPDAVDRVPGLLGVDPSRVVWAPNGFEPDSFDRREIDREALWRRWLVEEPRGWDPDSCKPGSVSYSEDELGPLLDGTVLVYSGRYTEVKRIPLLIRAFARASSDSPAALVLIGGYPGEWEGEHPLSVIEEAGASNVF